MPQLQFCASCPFALADTFKSNNQHSTNCISKHPCQRMPTSKRDNCAVKTSNLALCFAVICILLYFACQTNINLKRIFSSAKPGLNSFIAKGFFNFEQTSLQQPIANEKSELGHFSAQGICAIHLKRTSLRRERPF